MATWVNPIVGKPYPENQDQDRLLRTIDKNTVEVEIWKVDKKNVTLGSKVCKFPSSTAPFAAFVEIMGGEADVRALARQARFVRERASIGAKKGAGKNGSKGY